jgi:Thioredoxin
LKAVRLLLEMNDVSLNWKKIRRVLPRARRYALDRIPTIERTLIQSGVPLLGKPSAPITIVEFGDFQCEFCDRFAKQTELKINSTYVQTDKVNILVLIH